MKRLALALAGGVVTAVLPIHAAHAAPSAAVSIDVGNTTLDVDDCFDHDFGINVSPSFDTESWSVDLEIYGPDGDWEGSEYVYGDGPAYETGSVQLCSSLSQAGTYTISGELEVYDEDYDDYTYPLPTTTFVVSKTSTTTTISMTPANPRRDQPVTMRVHSIARNNREGIPYGSVVLQRYVRGRWENIQWSKDMLDSRGRTSMTGRANGDVRVRAVLKGDNAWYGSVSRPVWIDVR